MTRHIALCIGLLLAACQRQITMPPPVFPPVNEAAEIRDFIALVNDERVRAGCARLQLDARLAAVAEAHSVDMARRNFFEHTNPDGKSPFDRLSAAGIRYRYAAENIAYGQRRAHEVLQTWLNSPGHRRNIENCNYTHHGVGLQSTRWTHVFIGVR